MLENSSLDWVEYTRVNDKVTRVKERIVTEVAISIIVNGEHFATGLITPMMEEEFVVGHLFTEGVIDNIDDIKSMTIKDGIADVSLNLGTGKQKCSPQITSDFKVKKEDIFKGIEAILHSRLYEETRAIHSAGLFKQGAEPVCITEDVGRHNALDKVIGYALMKKIDFGNTFAASTGRMVADMVLKICVANIPVVATKTAVTKSGLEMGASCGVTIIGFVRAQGMNLKSGEAVDKREMRIYTNPERIII
jgi:FdhD protein